MNKYALFAFRGDSVRFIHVLLNALDMSNRGYDVQVIIEGEATKLIPELTQGKSFLNEIFQEVREKGLVGGVCRACATKMNTLKIADENGFTILADMSGHPSMSGFIENEYEIITF